MKALRLDVTPDLHERVRQAAESSHRSIAGWIRHAIDRALAEHTFEEIKRERQP